MKRRMVFKLLVFLLLGAIINVAVAWGGVAFHQGRFESPILQPEFAAKYLPSTWMLRDVKWVRSQSALMTIDYGINLSLTIENPDSVTIRNQGWPFRCLHGCEVENQALRNLTCIRIEGQTYFLSTGIQKSGFAINTIFYAAILWMIFVMPFAIRRRRRNKRGVCVQCAYPVGTNEKCTECGTAGAR
jgi:hypothetical protein